MANKYNTYRSKREGATEVTNDSMRARFTFVRIHAAASNSPDKISGRLWMDPHSSSCLVALDLRKEQKKKEHRDLKHRDRDFISSRFLINNKLGSKQAQNK